MLCFLLQQGSIISVKTAQLLPRKWLVKTMCCFDHVGVGRRDKKELAKLFHRGV